MTTDEQTPTEPTVSPVPEQPKEQDDSAAGSETTETVSGAASENQTDDPGTPPVTAVPEAVTAPPPASDSAPTPSVAETLAAAGAAPAQPQETSEPAAAAPAEPPVETPTAPAAETPAAPVVEAPEQPAPQTESPAAPAAAETQPTPTDDDQDRPAAKIREKLGTQHPEKAIGSEDILSQRPDIPTNVKPVDIPDADDLDLSLEAEIASAMSSAPAPETTTAAPAPAPETEAAAAEGAEPAAPVQEEVGPGSQVSGTVQQIHGDDVFLNAGLRNDVVVGLKQFPEDKQPSVGDTVSVVIDSVDQDGLFRARLPQARTKTGGNWDGLAVGQVVDCVVTGTNKGGLQVTVSNLKAFLPASQIDLGYVADLEQYVGQKLTVQITEVKPRKRNLVVSRRALLQAEREAQQAGFWESLEVGQDHAGTVKTIKNYGAFVNLGPIDGFLHVGEISWSRINHPNEVLKEGQEIQVRVLKIDRERSRISLGMKQLMQNPWQGLSDRYPAERIVPGKVTRIADFGAFVELEPGVEGLVHISELAWRRVGSVNEVLSVGDERDFKVLEVDPKRKRVSLSLKALEQKPESAAKPQAEEDTRPPRRTNPDLRGGMGENSGKGGLFGNPSDFT